MTVSVSDIRDIKKYVEDIHNNKTTEQLTDKGYYEDTFSLPLIKDSRYIIRTGAAASLVEGVTSQLLSDNPQVFREPRKDTAPAKESALKVAAFLNRRAKALQRQNPDRYKESFKNQLVRGELWLYTVHNENFAPDDPNSFPFNIYVPDPMVVYFDPREGEENGVPNRVLFLFQRTVVDLQRNYPLFMPIGYKINDKVPFLMYFDNEVRYFEAAELPLLRDKDGVVSNGDGIQENIYGFVPLTHAYSGLGKESPDGNPASLAVSRLRRTRDLFKEECTMGSDISFIIHKYAHKHLDIINKSGTPISPDQLEQYDMGAGIIQEVMLPEGAELVPSEPLAPAAEVFRHYQSIQGRLAMESPPILGGFALGSSGRQEDIVRGDWRKQYDTVLNNTQQAFATALGQGLRMMHDLPNLTPKGLKKTDIAGDYNCVIELRAEDPIEKDRLRTLGSRLYQAGEIDLETNLIKYQGYTQEDARKIMARRLVDNVTINSPIVAEILGIQFAREAGMEEEYAAILQAQKGVGGGRGRGGIGSQGGPPREGNIRTEQGQNEADLSLAESGQRRSPTQ